MFRWKILTPTFILTPFLLKFILTSMLIRHLRVCKMIISLGVLFSFLKNFDFLGQKYPKTGKKLVRTLSEKQHVIWLWFLVCLSILVFLVCLRHFFIFQKFKFWVKNGTKGQKLAKNNLQCCWHHFYRTIHQMILTFGCRCKMIIYPRVFFFFSKILIIWAKNWVKGTNGPK